ncbi:trypsin-like [Narcine bancroftii]|uniref:trypsin-like n=1 Tax=Narcine bancroftii TaxID=1343680 RepID=UPI0038311E41
MRVIGGWCTVLVWASLCSPLDGIVGGWECVAHSLPYQAYISRSEEKWCGASLLNPTWVLSAAHCYLRPELMTVWVGAHDLSAEEPSRQPHRVVRAVRHPEYSLQTTDSDLMLLKVQPPVGLSLSVEPVQLPDSCPSNGTVCRVAGWGNNVTGGELLAERLQCLDVPVLPDEICEGSYPGMITRNMFCAGIMEGGREACKVDSGGPLVCEGLQQGLVSWGYECGLPGYPSVYTKLCHYLQWINETLAEN